MKTEHIEHLIVTGLVGAILSAGMAISVHDGEELVISNSEKISDILASMFSTDSDTLIIRKHKEPDVPPVGTFMHPGYSRVGTVSLVYGNGWEVISDCSIGMMDVLEKFGELVEQMREVYSSAGYSQ